MSARGRFLEAIDRQAKIAARQLGQVVVREQCNVEALMVVEAHVPVDELAVQKVSDIGDARAPARGASGNQPRLNMRGATLGLETPAGGGLCGVVGVAEQSRRFEELVVWELRARVVDDRPILGER